MRRPQHDMSIFKQRRQALRTLAPNSAFVIPAGPEYPWQAYRQDSNFFYLSGFEEPGSYLLIRPGQTPEMVLFVRAKDPLKETWDGFRFGPKGAKDFFLADDAFLDSDFETEAAKLLQKVDHIYYPSGKNEVQDRRMTAFLENLKQSRNRTGQHFSMHDPNEILGEMRLIKSEYEQDCLKQAGAISARAHIQAMKFTKPGVTERQVMGQLLAQFYAEDARREGYNSIVASGNNSTTLHYNFNDQLCSAGDLLLIDSACEKNYYTADITRTFPVSGKFSEAQSDVYARVLSVQKSITSMVQVGVPFSKLQERTVQLLTEAMLELELLKGTVDENVETLAYKKYYPHGVSHFLGMDVHDVGLYSANGTSRPLEQGMVLTIEPGIYIPVGDESVPKELRGIGIRIEDDILVTKSGPINLTELAPKEIAEIETVMAH